jgi:hypothetical protein
VRLEGRGLAIGKYAIDPLRNRACAARGVDHRVALRERAAVQLLEILLQWLGDERIECVHNLGRHRRRDPEDHPDLRDDANPRNGREQIANEIRLAAF